MRATVALLLVLLAAGRLAEAVVTGGPSVVVPGAPWCGDGIANGSEDCDGADATACPGQCLPGCTCPVATTTSSTATTTSSSTTVAPAFTTTTAAPGASTSTTSTVSSTSSTLAPGATTSTTTPGATTTTTTLSGGPTRYVGPSGSNGNTGASPAAAWADVNYARSSSNPNRIGPGDTLVILSGTYPPFDWVCGDVDPAANGGVPNGVGANARSGTPGGQITITAAVEHGALFHSNGTVRAGNFKGCRNISIVGLYFDSQDNSSATGSIGTFGISKSTAMTVRRNLWNKNNRCGNNQVAEFSMSYGLVEENQCWRNSRHCMSFSGESHDNEVRRNYINNAGVTAYPKSGPLAAACLDNGSPRGGPEQPCLTSYPAARNKFENNYCEGSKAWGFTNQAGYGAWSGDRASSHTRWFANVTAGTFLGAKILSRPSDARGITDAVYDHLLCVNVGGFCIRHSVGNASIHRHITALNPGNLAPTWSADDPPYNSNSQAKCNTITMGPCSVTLEDSVIRGAVNADAADSPGQYFVTLRNVSAASYTGLASSCAGSGANQASCSGKNTTAPTLLGTSGTQCATFCPNGDAACDGTGVSGGDRGADVRCRYDAGVRGTGSGANVFATSGSASCTGTTGAGPVTTCAGGLNFCSTVVAGVNDGSGGVGDCRTYAERWLNQKANGSGCSLASVACP